MFYDNTCVFWYLYLGNKIKDMYICVFVFKRYNDIHVFFVFVLGRYDNIHTLEVKGPSGLDF